MDSTASWRAQGPGANAVRGEARRVTGGLTAAHRCATRATRRMGWIHTLRDFRRVQRGPDPHGVAIASSGGAVLAGAGFLALTAPAAGDPLAAKAHSRTVAAPPAFPGFRDRKPPRSPGIPAWRLPLKPGYCRAASQLARNLPGSAARQTRAFNRRPEPNWRPDQFAESLNSADGELAPLTAMTTG